MCLYSGQIQFVEAQHSYQIFSYQHHCLLLSVAITQFPRVGKVEREKAFIWYIFLAQDQRPHLVLGFLLVEFQVGTAHHMEFQRSASTNMPLTRVRIWGLEE